ncbi:MAG TPA: HD domain-containing protein [Anaerolineae bacterium]|nr:HD domain-containing protein [Anaerolineae bacterium]
MPTIAQARAWYEENDPVHGFDHVLRVLRLAEILGRELGADLEILRAAALLHDASGAFPGEGGARGAHEHASAEFAREVLMEEGWEPTRIEEVLHCIRSHRFRSKEEPASLEAKILFDADKLDVNGAFGVARTIGYAMQAGQPIFAQPSESFLQHGEAEPGEPHSAYHEYLFKLRHVRDRLYTEPARRIAETHHHVLTTFFDQLKIEAQRGAS